MAITRRDFLKAAGIFALSFPISPIPTRDPDLTWVYVNCEIDGERLAELMDIDRVRKDGEFIRADLTIPQADVWKCVRLVDDKDNRWHTVDLGKNWECPDVPFTIEIVQDRRLAVLNMQGQQSYRKV